MSNLDEDHFYRLMRERSGLTLTPAKAYLIESRLKPVASEYNLPDVAALLNRLRLLPTEAVIRRCVEAMATHETFFFRDSTPFDQLRRALPELINARARTKTLRIWSAACSSGQEPFSIALLLQEFAGRLAGWQVEILATDMSETVLEKARVGRYSVFEAGRGLTPEQRKRWMVESGEHWEVSPSLKSMVTFRRHNLLDGTAGLGGLFDVVFCRNVLIYFEPAAKGRALDAVATVTAPDGLVFLGSAETVLGLTDRLEAALDGRGCFRRTGIQTRALKTA